MRNLLPSRRGRRGQQRGIQITALCTSTFLLASCGDQGVFDGAGRQGRDTAHLGVFLFLIAAGVFVFVITLLLASVARSRRRPAKSGGGTGTETGIGPLVIFGGFVLPITVLTSVFLIVLPQLSDHARTDADLVIEVTGHEWWWEVDYPRFTTANEIHVPVGQRVRIELTSDDVIHSFWVPSLAGKRDAIPGTTNSFVFEAIRAGSYHGSCAEYCGLNHARMKLLVVAEEPDAYARWAQRQAGAAAVPRDPERLRGQQVFLGSSCGYCHQVRGTSALSDFGPDLTHLATRQTLGAGVVTNNPGNLAGWVVDAQHLKSGIAMPAYTFSGEDLQALLAYLEELD